MDMTDSASYLKRCPNQSIRAMPCRYFEGHDGPHNAFTDAKCTASEDFGREADTRILPSAKGGG